jgi:hypothetical protein
MHVSIRSEMKRRMTRGEPRRFVFLGNGLFSLVDLVAGKPSEKARTALEQIRESRRDAAELLRQKLTSANNGPNFVNTMLAGSEHFKNADADRVSEGAKEVRLEDLKRTRHIVRLGNWLLPARTYPETPTCFNEPFG